MNDAVCKLPKLKTFSCERHISKGNIYWIVPSDRESNYFLFFFAEFVEAMTEAYPIVEDLRLTANRRKTIPPDHTPILSAFRFPHLTFLSLSNFQLLDGAALLPVKFEVTFVIEAHLSYFICCIFRSSKSAQSWRAFILILMHWIQNLSRLTWNFLLLLLPSYVILGNFRSFFFLTTLAWNLII